VRSIGVGGQGVDVVGESRVRGGRRLAREKRPTEAMVATEDTWRTLRLWLKLFPRRDMSARTDRGVGLPPQWRRRRLAAAWRGWAARERGEGRSGGGVAGVARGREGGGRGEVWLLRTVQSVVRAGRCAAGQVGKGGCGGDVIAWREGWGHARSGTLGRGRGALHGYLRQRAHQLPRYLGRGGAVWVGLRRRRAVSVGGGRGGAVQGGGGR